MGLRMGDLHAPTVPSGPTTNGASSIDEGRKSLFDLMNERDRIESELSALSSVLVSVSIPASTESVKLTGCSTMSTSKHHYSRQTATPAQPLT